MDQDALLQLLARFEAEGVAYVLVGGHAVRLNGFVRATEDIDVLLPSSRQNGERVIRALDFLASARELDPAWFEVASGEPENIRVADDLLIDLLFAANEIAQKTFRPLETYTVVALIYFVVIFLAMMWVNNTVDALMNYYIALIAMYATAMFGMVILVGLSGQVSLGNGALMAVGGYVFAVTSLNWQTVPILGMQWNAVWSVIFAGLGGVIAGLIIGTIALIIDLRAGNNWYISVAWLVIFGLLTAVMVS